MKRSTSAAPRRPHIDLSGSKIRRADLRGANLVNVDFRKADLSHADLRDADLRGARLDGTILVGADLRGARNLSREQLVTAIVDSTTRLPGDLTSDGAA